MAPTGLTAVALGTTTPGTFVVRIGTGTILRTGTITSAFVVPPQQYPDCILSRCCPSVKGHYNPFSSSHSERHSSVILNEVKNLCTKVQQSIGEILRPKRAQNDETSLIGRRCLRIPKRLISCVRTLLSF